MSSLGPALALFLRIYDTTGVTAVEHAHAETAAMAALHSADIDLTWQWCAGGPASRGAVPCVAPASAEVLTIRIVHPSQTGVALGEAYVDTGRARGSLATVFIDRVHALADAAGIDRGTLLGRVAAHEVGHLLAGDDRHAASGLMRARWTADALQRNSDRAWTFSPGQARQLQRRLRERAADVSPALAVAEPRPAPRPCARVVGH